MTSVSKDSVGSPVEHTDEGSAIVDVAVGRSWVVGLRPVRAQAERCLISALPEACPVHPSAVLLSPTLR